MLRADLVSSPCSVEAPGPHPCRPGIVRAMSGPPARVVTYSPTDHDVAFIRFDDGKANALNRAAIDQLHESLSRAEHSAKAVHIEGRPGCFCAGFDLAVMKGGEKAALELVRAGAELALRLYEFPRPTVAACTGHALAMGAILLMATDVRIGVEGEYKIGLNEVAAGMPVPMFASDLARDRLARKHYTRAVNLAEIHTPEEAVDAGFLDEITTPGTVHDLARYRARNLAASLDPAAFRATRATTRATTATGIRAGLEQDLSTFFVRG